LFVEASTVYNILRDGDSSIYEITFTSNPGAAILDYNSNISLPGKLPSILIMSGTNSPINI
jgi:hypothetical protein